MAKINGTSAADSLIGTALADTIFGAAGNDTLAGRAGDDLLAGGTGNDKLIGEAGGDSLHGDAGADAMDGGLGFDWALYLDGATAGVRVSLYQHTGTGGTAAGDTLFNIEGVQATKFADVVYGNALSNTLLGNDGNDQLFGREGDDSLQGGRGGDRLDGGAGTDWALYDDSKTAVIVSLFNNANGLGAAGDKLFAIENVQGSALADVLTGNTLVNVLSGGAGADRLYGREGDDQLRGGAGADRLDGGAGTDWAIYDDAKSAINVNFTLNAGFGGAAGDTFFSIENLQGSAFADVVRGNAANNLFNGGAGGDQLYGLGGDDQFTGGAGADRLDGGTGTDWVLYHQGAAAGVAVSLSSIGNGTGAGGDVLVSIENAQGTDFADTLSGSAVDNFLIGRGGGDKLFGRAGNDQLQGGGGADWLDGGEGSDWAMYDDSETRVTINLLTNVHALGAAGDKLFSIENVQGSAFNDSITGNTVDNLLLGGAGDDGLFGGLGNDQLRGGLGKDTLDGGAGNSDWALYRDGATQGITLFLADNTANARGAFGDRLFNIENVQGTEFADLIHGNAAANVLAGNGGDDVLYGEGGGDNLSGGLGGDQIHGGGGDDVLFGGAGNDHLFDEEAANAADSDTFLPGAGADTVTGDGNDTVEYSDAAAGVAVDLTQTGAGQTGGAADGDTLTGILGIAGSGFNDTLISSLTGNGADIAVLRGFAGSDSITLNHNFDQAFGGDDADTIVLKAASQTANGGDGNDVLVASLATAARLIGGAGSDTMTGNATAIDQFVIEKVSGVDTITNFLQSGQSGAGRDLLVLSLSGFGLGATFEAGELVSSGTGAAVGAAAQLIYNETTHELWFDADGTTAVEAAMKLALLQNAPAHLTLADFGVLA